MIHSRDSIFLFSVLCLSIHRAVVASREDEAPEALFRMITRIQRRQHHYDSFSGVEVQPAPARPLLMSCYAKVTFSSTLKKKLGE